MGCYWAAFISKLVHTHYQQRYQFLEDDDVGTNSVIHIMSREFESKFKGILEFKYIRELSGLKQIPLPLASSVFDSNALPCNTDSVI